MENSTGQIRLPTFRENYLHRNSAALGQGLNAMIDRVFKQRLQDKQRFLLRQAAIQPRTLSITHAVFTSSVNRF